MLKYVVCVVQCVVGRGGGMNPDLQDDDATIKLEPVNQYKYFNTYIIWVDTAINILLFQCGIYVTI